MKKDLLLKLLLILFCFSCSSDNKPRDILVEDNIEAQMSAAYKEAIFSLEKRDFLFAANKFNDAELLYPQSLWAPRAALMSAYTYYSGNYYSDSVYELKRFIKVYPDNKNLDYAYYLLAMNYYETIVDESKDLGPMIQSRKYFEHVIKNYPQTDYAVDARFKLDLIKNIFAAKQMYIGRHYIKKQKWIPALNRFKVIIKDYENTIYVEEALHRLVEINYKIGLITESEKYAKLLGYNYQSGDWYKASYKVFNKKYIAKKRNSNKNKKKLKNIVKKLFQ